MRAVLMKQPGDPETLEVTELTQPLCGKGEVLVRVMAAGVNPIDTKLRSRGLYFPEGMPAILGCDGAGIVEKIGDGVSHFSPGDTVYYCYGGLGQKSGNYAEYSVVPENYLAHKPAGLDFASAAAAPLVLITAWEALFDRAGMRSGQKIFIHAGAGGVGHIAIQLAKIAGCEVATSISSGEKAAFVQELGADLAINYKTEDIAAALLDWTGGNGVDIAFDTVGGAAFDQLIPAVRAYGDLVTILQVPDQTDWKTIRLRNIRVSHELMLTPMVLDLPDAAEHQAAILDQCRQLFDDNHLTVFVNDILPLEKAAEAHHRIESGHMTGKLVLDIAGDADDSN